MIEPFYGVTFGHKLNKFAAWAIKNFGEAHRFVAFARSWEPWVKRLLKMRNAVDHPRNGHGGRLRTRNFFLEEGTDRYTLHPPLWWLEGSQPGDMVADMAGIIEGLITLQENALVALFHERKGALPLGLVEIPAERRDPKCPVRFVVTFTQDFEG